jgi:hypothetical protein
MTAMLSLMDRRQFLGQVTITLSGAALGGLLPVSQLRAATPAACLVDASAWPDPCGDWRLDDICNAYPPPSLHLEPAVPGEMRMSAPVQPVDLHWVA